MPQYFYFGDMPPNLNFLYAYLGVWCKFPTGNWQKTNVGRISQSENSTPPPKTVHSRINYMDVLNNLYGSLISKDASFWPNEEKDGFNGGGGKGSLPLNIGLYKANMPKNFEMG